MAEKEENHKEKKERKDETRPQLSGAAASFIPPKRRCETITTAQQIDERGFDQLLNQSFNFCIAFRSEDYYFFSVCVHFFAMLSRYNQSLQYEQGLLF